MVDNVVKINEDIYPIADVIKDINALQDKIQDMVFVTLLKDGTATVSHTGLTFSSMALACKLLDVEFNNMIQLEIEATENI